MTANTLRSLKKYYHSQTGQPIVLHSPIKNVKQIVLIRHGEPDVKKFRRRYKRDEVLQYDRDYYNSRIIPFQQKPVKPDELPVEQVHHSSLNRATHTAELIFEGHARLKPDFRFREFPRHVIRDFGISLPLKYWKLISRISWFMGFSAKDLENSKRAFKRARGNAEYLIDEAEEHGMAILVAHGLHNRFVIRNLKRRYGWEIVYSSGFNFLGTQILAREVSASS